MSGTKCGVLLEIGGNIGLVGQWYVVAATLLDEGTLLCKKQFGLGLVLIFLVFVCHFLDVCKHTHTDIYYQLLIFTNTIQDTYTPTSMHIHISVLKFLN